MALEFPRHACWLYCSDPQGCSCSQRGVRKHGAAGGADLSMSLFSWVMTIIVNNYCLTGQGVDLGLWGDRLHPYCSSKFFGSSCLLCAHANFKIRLSNAVKKNTS